MFQLKYKIWLDKGGKVFGEGPYLLLKGIENNGSLKTSATNLRMSYSQAYNLIKLIEERLGFSLIYSQAGGTGGGGSHLTPEAKVLMKQYKAFIEECDEKIQLVFDKYFGE